MPPSTRCTTAPRKRWWTAWPANASNTAATAGTSCTRCIWRSARRACRRAILTTFSQGMTKDGYFLDCWPAYDRLARLMERQLDLTGWGPILDHGVGFNFDCWHHYLYTGDLDALREPYPRLLRFAQYLQAWLAPTACCRSRTSASPRSGSTTTPTNASATSNAPSTSMRRPCCSTPWRRCAAPSATPAQAEAADAIRPGPARGRGAADSGAGSAACS